MIGGPRLSNIQNGQPSDFTCSTDEQPQDSVSCLAWQSDLIPDQYFACSSWDSTIRTYQIQENTLRLASSITTEHPCLSVVWQERDHLVGGCIDGKVLLIENQTGSITSFGGERGHTDAVNNVFYSELEKIIVSLSYDKTLKVWDFRQSNPIFSLELHAKPYAADLKFGILALGYSDGKLAVTKLQNLLNRPNSPFSYLDPPFHPEEKFTDLSLYNLPRLDLSLGLVASSDCGRAYITKIQPTEQEMFTGMRIITYQAHYSSVNTIRRIMSPVNAVGMHPLHYAMFTAGGNGALHLWDCEQRKKSATYMTRIGPITKAKFNSSGTKIVYAYGYDYAQGIQGLGSFQSGLRVVNMREEDCFVKKNIQFQV